MSDRKVESSYTENNNFNKENSEYPAGPRRGFKGSIWNPHHTTVLAPGEEIT